MQALSINNLKMKILTLIILFFLFFVLSCNTLRGHNGVCENIKESKNRGVFICEYMPLNNPYRINDSISLTIEEAWVERNWKYSENNNETVVMEEFQVCVNTYEKDIAGICFDWSIGINGDLYLRSSSKNSLIGDFKTLPPDTIEYKVQKGSEFSDNYEKIIIGKFGLVKK